MGDDRGLKRESGYVSTWQAEYLFAVVKSVMQLFGYINTVEGEVPEIVVMTVDVVKRGSQVERVVVTTELPTDSPEGF